MAVGHRVEVWSQAVTFLFLEERDMLPNTEVPDPLSRDCHLPSPSFLSRPPFPPPPPVCGQVPDLQHGLMLIFFLSVLSRLVNCPIPCLLHVSCVYLSPYSGCGVTLPSCLLPLPAGSSSPPGCGWAAYNARLQGLGHSVGSRRPPLHRLQDSSLSGSFLSLLSSDLTP